MSKHRNRGRQRVGVLGATAATAAAVMAGAATIGTGVAAAQDGLSVLSNGSCPALLVLGVQGTSESSPTADPRADTGMLGEMFRPMTANGVSVEHVTVPYDASFGGAPGTGPGVAPFADSVATAGAELSAMASEAIAQCPETQLGLAGFSQGALVVQEFAEQVGAERGPVPADRVAGVALLSNPARTPGGDPIPGRPGQLTPSPAPGTDGAATAAVTLGPVPVSGGIVQGATGFGALTGRVGEFCTPGDLSCDAPGQAAALRTVAGLAAQADLRDPIAALPSLGAAWQSTVTETSTAVMLNDVHVDGGQANYVPQESVSQRLAEAADPRTPAPNPEQTQAVADKVGQVVSAVVADPLGQIPRLIGQVGAAVAANVAANADLLNPGVLLHYADVVGRHTGYAGNGQTEHAADWFSALSRDLSGGAGGQ